MPFMSLGYFQLTSTFGLPVKLQLRTIVSIFDMLVDEGRATSPTLGVSGDKRKTVDNEANNKNKG